MKINSSRFRKANWNLTLDLRDAIRNGEVVTLAESQCLRWIDQINGTSTSELQEQVKQIRKKIKMLKSDSQDQEAIEQVKSLYIKLNNLLFISEYLLIVMENEKDYLRLCEGFYLNGKHYRRLLSTAGGVKLSTIIFMSDESRTGAVMHDEIMRRIENGRNPTKALVPAKLESYRSLVCSASTPVSSPRSVLVVPDCVTHFKGDYILLSDNPDGGEPLYEEVRGGDIELDNSDGYGLISPELAEIWSAELGLDETASGFCCRNAYTKGMLFPFRFDEFALNVAHQTIVKDIWGTERNIMDVDSILTESMLKLWSSYDSLEDWQKHCIENQYTFSVTKVAESHLKESRPLNYEFLQPFQLSDNDLDELIAPTLRDLEGVMGGDPAKANLFMRGTEQSAESVANANDDYVKAATIDKTVFNDPYVRSSISNAIRKRCDRAKLGRVRVRGDFQVVGGDMYALCQSIFGMEVTGLLNTGEIFSWYWVNRGADTVLAFRAPMSNMNNIKKVHIESSDAAKHWYQYAKGVVIINAWDQMMAALNGMDMDGDTVLTTDNEVLLRNYEDTLVIQCAQRTAEKKIPTEEDIIKSNLQSFGSRVGEYTNYITSYYDVLAQFPHDSEEYKQITYRIICGQHYSQAEIDKAKGIISPPMHRYWYDRRAAAKQDEESGCEINRKIVADRKPAFMRYRYPALSKEYNAYIKQANYHCRVNYGCSADDLLRKQDRSPEEENGCKWLMRNSPASMADGTMNRTCRRIEDALSKIKNKWRKNGEVFNYAVYRSEGATYPPKAFVEVKKIIDRYKKELKLLPAYAKENKLTDDEIKIIKTLMAEATREECYCCDLTIDQLTNVILDVTYGDGHPSSIVWDLVGDVIIKNLLKRHHGEVYYYVKDPDGEIEYNGETFKECKHRVEEISNNYSE